MDVVKSLETVDLVDVHNAIDHKAPSFVAYRYRGALASTKSSLGASLLSLLLLGQSAVGCCSSSMTTDALLWLTLWTHRVSSQSSCTCAQRSRLCDRRWSTRLAKPLCSLLQRTSASSLTRRFVQLVIACPVASVTHAQLTCVMRSGRDQRASARGRRHSRRACAAKDGRRAQDARVLASSCARAWTRSWPRPWSAELSLDFAVDTTHAATA